MESRKLISATDTQYSGRLLTSLNEQRTNGIFCDVTVIVEDKKFRAHRNILSASSTYFHQLFSDAGQVVELNFVRAEIFAEILNYIYSSKIVRVRSDLLEELYKSGKLLGVKFIADLGVPLSQMKSMAGGVKNNISETSPSSLDQKVINSEKPATEQTARYVLHKDGGISKMPLITDGIVLANDELKDSKQVADSEEKRKDSDDDDVIFCSELVPPKPESSNTEIVQQRTSQDGLGVPHQPMCGNSSTTAQTLQNALSMSNVTLTGVIPPQTNFSVKISSPSQVQPSVAIFDPFQNRMDSNTLLPNQYRHYSPTANMLVNQLPFNNVCSSKPSVIGDGSSATSEDLSTSSPGHQANTEKPTRFDGPRLQNSQTVTTVTPGEVNNNIPEDIPRNDKGCEASMDTGSPQHFIDGKKLFTLDTPPQIGEHITGCKVYENIGEDTYDIVVPIKDNPDDDGAVECPRSADGSPNSKRMKLKHEDHYELTVDGKVYYICILCKRSYGAITSLKRHFNCHSWEKKYPCRYCEKVFALAEYRTKHEIQHTGERRYQCLKCGETFMNHQIMSSHFKSVHSLDPSKDPTIYRLNPSSTLQRRAPKYRHNANASNSVPLINDAGIVDNVDAIKETVADDALKEETVAETLATFPDKDVNFDDVFLAQVQEIVLKSTPPDASPEFEFVIPESY